MEELIGWNAKSAHATYFASIRRRGCPISSPAKRAIQEIDDDSQISNAHKASVLALAPRCSSGTVAILGEDSEATWVQPRLDTGRFGFARSDPGGVVEDTVGEGCSEDGGWPFAAVGEILTLLAAARRQRESPMSYGASTIWTPTARR